MFDRKSYMQEYNRKYSKDNKEKKAAYVKEWLANNPEKVAEYSKTYRLKKSIEISDRRKSDRSGDKHDYLIERDKKYRQSTPKTFLSWLFGHAKKGKHNDKIEDGDQIIELTDVLDLWDKQKGCCAITQKKMVCQWSTLFSASIDRIDSKRGYVKGNIQLVCQAINLAKNKYTQEDILFFWKNQSLDEPDYCI